MSDRTVKQLMTNKEMEVRAELVASLEGQHVVLTTDHWTSVAKQNYTGLTSHHINSKWELVSHELGCILHEGRTRAEDCYNDLIEKLWNDCHLGSINITAVVSDSAANLNKFGAKLEETNISHIYCTDHIIQRTVVKAHSDDLFGETFQKPLEKAKGLVGYFNGSSQATEALIKQQKESGVPEGQKPKVLTQDVITRWWATHRMLETAAAATVSDH